MHMSNVIGAILEQITLQMQKMCENFEKICKTKAGIKQEKLYQR